MKYGEQFNPFGYFTGLFIPNCIAQSDLSDSAKLLLGRLFQYAGRDGKAFPGRKELKTELNWKIRKLDRYIKELKDRKLIKTYQKTEHSPSTYIFLYHEIYDSRGTVTNDSRGTVIYDKQKRINKEENHKKDLSKDKSMRSKGPQRQKDKDVDQDCSKIKKNKSEQSCTKKKILPKIKKKSCKPKNTIDNPYLKHKITISDLRNYNELKSHGITNHKTCTKAEADSLDKLHTLFDSRCKPPYHPIYIPPEFIDYNWSIDDLIEIFKFQLEHASEYNMKPIRAIGKFIFSEGYNGFKSWSPLLYWAQKMMKTDDSLTEEGFKLFKVMKQNKIRGSQELDSSIINRVARELNEAKERYVFVDSTSGGITYPAGIISVFTKYLKEKLNKLNFELVYIAKKGFVDEFLHIAVKRNILRRKNGRRGVNG